MAISQVKLSKHLSHFFVSEEYHFFQEYLSCSITSTFAFLDYSAEKPGHFNEIHKVGILLPVCL